MSLARILITLIFVGAGIGMLQVLVMPAWAGVGALRTEVGNIEEAISLTREVIRKRDEMEQRYQSLSPEEIERIRAFLPSKSEVGELLIDVDALAKKADVKITGLTFQENAGQSPVDSAESGIQEVSINFSVSGSYASLQQFITSVQRNLRLIDITNVTFTGADKDEFLFSIKARAYYQQGGIF